MSSRSPSDAPGAERSTGGGPGPGAAVGGTKPVRVDKWLWAVRVFKTRTSATAACNAGRVRIGDEPAKPATKVQVGDVVEARRGDRTIVYRVTGLVDKRVGAKLVPRPRRGPVATADPTPVAARGAAGRGP